MKPSSVADVDSLVALACSDVAINSVINTPDKTDAEKLYAVLSAMPATTALERANYVDRIQKHLSDKGLITKQARYTWVPPKQKLIREADAASDFLDFERLWFKVLELCIVNARSKMDSRLSDDCRAGMLIVVLATECGALSAAEIKAVLHELASTGIRTMERLTYVTTPYRCAATPHGTLDSRRLFLSPLATCMAASLPPDIILAAARKPDTVLKAFSNAAGIQFISLSGLLDAIATGIHFVHFPPYWLFSWMKHDNIYSSCLNEACFLRLNGFTAPSPDKEPEALPGNNEYSELDDDGSILEFSDVFGKLTKVLRTTISVDSSHSQIESLRGEITEYSNDHPAIDQLYDWLLYLHTQLKKTSTIRLYFTAAASSVLSFCERQDLSTLTRDDWVFIFEKMIDEAISSSRKSNIATALNSLISYLNKAYGREIALLPSGKDVAIANAHILTKQDLGNVCRHIRSPVSPLPVRDQDAAVKLTTLAWHTGMRRNELLSLPATSLKQGNRALLEVKDTAFFKAKSSASLRDIPLAIFDAFDTSTSWISENTGSAYLIKTPGNSKPGEPDFEASCEKMVRGINRSIEEVTGSRNTTVHSLRHTFCTQVASHLLGNQFHFSLLSRDLPLIDQIYDDMTAYQLTEALVPASYSGYAEVQILRDLMGHASERTTFLHYLHIMDLFRLGMLKFLWNDDIEVLSGAAGLSHYSMQKCESTHSLLNRLLDKCALNVIRPVSPGSVSDASISALAHALLRDFGIISKALSLAERPNSLLSHLSLIPDCLDAYKVRFNEISPNALSLLSAGAHTKSLIDLRPTDLPERQFAARLCQNLVTWLTSIPNEDQDYNLHRLIYFIDDLFSSSARHTSSAVTVRDSDFLSNLLDFTAAIIGCPESHLRFYRRNKSNGQTASHFIDTGEVLQLHLDAKLDFTSLKVKFHFPEDPLGKNDVSTFSWLISLLYITLQSVCSSDITSKIAD